MKKLIRQKVENLLYTTQKNLNDKVISAGAFQYLTTHLSGGKILPYNSWSISPQGMLMIVNHILINDVRTIVEFGSGISTIFLNNLDKVNGLGLKIYSVDHDAGWQKKLAAQYGLGAVNFIQSDLKHQFQFKGRSFNWYDPARLSTIDKAKVDFMIVDGPIGASGLYERAGAFEFFKEEMKRDTFSYYLDDTNFKELEEVIRFYADNFNLYSTYALGGHGKKYEIEPVLFRK